MLLLLKVPKCGNQLLVAKHRFEHYYKLTPSKIEKYITFKQASLLYPLGEDTLFKRLVTSQTLHGFELNEKEIFIHPDPFFTLIRSYYKSRMTRAITSKKKKSQGLPLEN